MATARIEEKEAIILSRVKQKEHDAMISALGPEGPFSFYARGSFKMGSPTSFCTQEGALSLLTLAVSSRGALTLREGKIEKLYQPRHSLDAMLAASAILEYPSRLLEEGDGPALYPWLSAALDGLERGKDPNTILLIFLSQAMKLAGYGFDVDSCVVCHGKKDIVALDPVQGGFLCENCLREAVSPIQGVSTLKVFRHAFRCRMEDIGEVTYPQTDARVALKAVLETIADRTGVRLSPLKFLFERS